MDPESLVSLALVRTNVKLNTNTDTHTPSVAFVACYFVAVYMCSKVFCLFGKI